MSTSGQTTKWDASFHFSLGVGVAILPLSHTSKLPNSASLHFTNITHRPPCAAGAPWDADGPLPLLPSVQELKGPVLHGDN